MCGLSAKNQDSPDSLLLSFLAGGSGGEGLWPHTVLLEALLWQNST